MKDNVSLVRCRDVDCPIGGAAGSGTTMPDLSKADRGDRTTHDVSASALRG